MNALRFLAALAACWPLAARAEPPVWQHGVFVPKADAGIVLMNARGDFAAKAGLDLKIVELKDDPGLLRALVSGNVDSIEGGPGIGILAAAHGAEVRILGCYWPVLPHGIFASQAVQAPADLRGRTIAIAGPSGAPDLVIRAMLKTYGIPAGEEHFADLGGDADRYKALAAGLVDATVVSMEYVPLAHRNGLHLLAAARDVLPDYMRTCIETTAQAIATRRPDVVAYVASQIASLRYAVSHRDETLALTRAVTRTPADDPRPAFIFDDAVKSGSIDTEMGLHMDKLEWMQRQLLSIGNLQKPMDLSKLVDGSIRDEALRKLAAQ